MIRGSHRLALTLKRVGEKIKSDFLFHRLRLSLMLALIVAFGWVLSSLLRRTPRLKDQMAPLSGIRWKLEQVGGLLGPILSTCPAAALFLCSLSLALAVSSAVILVNVDR
jgi:hypothetical protein